MEPSGNWWVDIAISAGKWAMAGVATLGSSAVIYIGKRYRDDSDKLEDAHEYFQRLRKAKVIARVVTNTRNIRITRKALREALRENKVLINEIRKYTSALTQYESACQNLSAAVELRAKEHHEFRGNLQAYLNRLTIVETELKLRHDWRHDPK